MRKKSFNNLVGKGLEKSITIALFSIVAAVTPLFATAPTAMQDAGYIACPLPTPELPVWGKLVVSGNTVTCFYGIGLAAPAKWTQIGAPQTINFLNNPVLVGLFFSTNGGNGLGNGTIDNFSITPAPTYRLADYDVGAPALMGSANLINGVWNLAGSGAAMWASFDQCNFQSWLVWGDCTVVCRATAFLSGTYNEKMGIMIRDGFNSGSDCALFCVKRTGDVDFQYRLSFKNNPDITEFVAPPAPGVKSGVAVGYGLTGGTTYTLRP